MPSVPKLCKHKRSRQWYVTLDGHQHYLGEVKSTAQIRYDELVSRWMANGRSLPSDDPEITIAQLVIRYVKFASSHYVKNGKATNEFTQMKSALRPLNSLYGTLEAIESGPN